MSIWGPLLGHHFAACKVEPTLTDFLDVVALSYGACRPKNPGSIHAFASKDAIESIPHESLCLDTLARLWALEQRKNRRRWSRARCLDESSGDGRHSATNTGTRGAKNGGGGGATDAESLPWLCVSSAR